jgi:DNA ligase 1
MPHVVEQLSAVLKDGDTLDGELFVPGFKFEQIASWIKRAQEDSCRIQYHVYDALLDAPFIDRYQQAQALLRRLSKDIIVPVETRLMTDLDQLMAFQADCVGQGLEGAMLRYGKHAYDAGKRSKYLLKVKTFQDAEFLITGVSEGRGTHAGMAVFKCRTAAGHAFDVLSPGTHAEKRSIWHQPPSRFIGRMLTVKFQEFTTTEQPVPRFPVALRLSEQV